MAKKLSERIREHVSTKKPNKRAKNLAAFLANKEEIEAAINDNGSVKIIWETLHDEGRISISYQAFNNYVNRHIRAKNVKQAQPISQPENEHQEAEVTKRNTSTGFVFNSTPNKEDLV